jgi:predicted ferric reductase
MPGPRMVFQGKKQNAGLPTRKENAMRKITWTFWLLIGGLTALWLLADTLWPAQAGLFALRTVWVQYSGVLAMGMMSVAMLLAARPAALEPLLGGLDKMYRLHKWLGIGALMLSVTHWLWAKGPKWAVGWGWLERPQRGPRPQTTGLEAVLGGWRGTAEGLGEWAFYAAVVLIVLALIKRFPYRLFAKTHTLLAVAYLVLAFHTVVLIRFDYWTQPIGWVMALLVAAGTVSALRVLTRQVGAGRRAQGTIEALHPYPALQVLQSTLRMDERWHGHQPGQFAFVTRTRAEGAHPYTIASAWDAGERRIVFVTKALGDYTRTLADTLRVGERVTVEGPYGCFTFGGAQRRQIWVGAGIGITPFIARMNELAREGGDGREIDLFHSTAVADEAALARMRADAEAAGIRLHILVDARDGRLSGERLRAAVPRWRESSVWFCGPASFGQALRKDLTAHGLPADAFHQELFEMR